MNDGSSSLGSIPKYEEQVQVNKSFQVIRSESIKYIYIIYIYNVFVCLCVFGRKRTVVLLSRKCL